MENYIEDAANKSEPPSSVDTHLYVPAQISVLLKGVICVFVVCLITRNLSFAIDVHNLFLCSYGDKLLAQIELAACEA